MLVLTIFFLVSQTYPLCLKTFANLYSAPTANLSRNRSILLICDWLERRGERNWGDRWLLLYQLSNSQRDISHYQPDQPQQPKFRGNPDKFTASGWLKIYTFMTQKCYILHLKKNFFLDRCRFYVILLLNEKFNFLNLVMALVIFILLHITSFGTYCTFFPSWSTVYILRITLY